MERQYALKWNDFHVKLTSSFQHLRNEFDFIDVTLAGDGYSFSAHKVILSACSPYFRQLLKANPCQHPIIILRDVNKQNMENLLMFMYNGEVNLEHEQLADFIKAAQLLKIRGLADIKDSFAQLGNDSFENISSPTPPAQEKFTPSTSTYERPTIPEPEPELIIPNMITEPDPHSMEAPSSSHSHEPELIDQKISIADLIEPKQEPIEIIDEDLSLEDVCSVEDISNMSSMSNQSYNDPNNETATTSNLSLPGSSDQKRPRIEGPTRHVVRNRLRLERRALRNNQNPFEMPDLQFIRSFRLNKHLVRELIDSLEVHSNKRIRSTGIPFHLRVLVTLYFLSNGAYQGSTGGYNFTCMSQPSVSRSISEICTLITTHLMPIYINFPTNTDEKHIVKQGFYQKYKMSGILGIIDGTHVEIIAPHENIAEHPPFIYINRKGTHSINVMLICDSDHIILAVNAITAGSIHDSAIWRESDIKSYLKSEYETGDKSTHLLGDKDYGLEPWLFTPYEHYAEDTKEERFNILHTQTWGVIERTIAMIKSRFRCLSSRRILNYHPAKSAHIIYSCAVLHNIATKAGMELADEFMDELHVDEFVNKERPMSNALVQDPDLLSLGIQARDLYVQENML